LVFPLTLPRNCPAVTILSSVMCPVFSPCCVCCFLTALVSEQVAVKHKDLLLAAVTLSLHSLSIACPVALIVSDVTFLVLRKGIYFITIKLPTFSVVSGGKLHIFIAIASSWNHQIYLMSDVLLFLPHSYTCSPILTPN
jgi:hypothetical protein